MKTLRRAGWIVLSLSIICLAVLLFVDFGGVAKPSRPDVAAVPDVVSNTLPSSVKKDYPLHTNITATVFWVGEPQGRGSSENNAISAWDDAWLQDFGGVDDPVARKGYYPSAFVPHQNPFYLDLPYDDVDDSGNPKPDRITVIPWGRGTSPVDGSLLKNRWVEVMRGDATCYGQWEDSGPYVYDDVNYVFGAQDQRPRNTLANNAGMDVSPALRDCLKFVGVNNDENTVSWRFIEMGQVPDGPWKAIVTTD